MDLHNEVMNIQIDEKETKARFPDEEWEFKAYKLGHRDARHAAAELALKVDARIGKLETVLKDMYVASGTVANCAYNVGQYHEDWENIKQWIDKLDNARAAAIKVFQGKK